MKNSLGMFLLVGCMATDTTTARINVDQPNELGITALEVDRASDGTDFELRGLDAQGTVQATVHRHIGDVQGSNVGTQLSFSVGGRDAQLVTRETQLIQLIGEDVPVAKPLLAIDAVVSELARDHIKVIATQAPGGEAAYWAAGCSSGSLNQSPTAYQCCEMDYSGMHRTIFVNPSGQISIRYYNNVGYAGCRASDGVSGCNGTSCYYGPNGYARAQLYNNPGGYFPYTQSIYGNWCQGTWQTWPVPPAYPATTGSFPNNQNCPGGDGGDNSTDWDY